MTLSPRIPDDEIEANAAVVAAEVLAHPIVLQLTPATVGALSAIAIEERRVEPGTARRLLRQAITFIDTAEVRLSMEARP